MVEEEEDDEEHQLPAPEVASAPESIHRLQASDIESGGLEVRKKPQGEALASSSPTQQQQQEVVSGLSSYAARRQHIAAALAAKTGGGAADGPSEGAIPPQDAAAKVMADLEVLKHAKKGVSVVDDLEEMSEVDVEEWRKRREQEGQAGDGRTKLNDLLGY